MGGVLPAPLIIFSTFVGYMAAGPSGAHVMMFAVFLPAFVLPIFLPVPTASVGGIGSRVMALTRLAELRSRQGALTRALRGSRVRVVSLCPRIDGLRVLSVVVCVVAVAVPAPAAGAAERRLSCQSLSADGSRPYWARQRNVTVLADSVLQSGEQGLRNVMACRRVAVRGRPALMLRIADRELRASGRRVAPLVVIGLGYNSLWGRNRERYGYWARRFDGEALRLVQTLRRLGARQIVWVTLREPRAEFLTAAGRGELHRYSWYFPYVNERLRALDRDRDDVVLADWAAVSNRKGLTYDSIHLTRTGGLLMGRTIRAAIDAEADRQALSRRR